MDPTDALKQAVLGAAQIQSPNSTLGASQAPELAQLYKAGFQLPQSSGAASALGQVTADQLAAQKAAEAAAKKASGLGKYQQLPKEDGGFTFIDPDGNEISAAEYAAATGTTPSAVLKDSKNPIDRAYLLDSKQLENYINDKAYAKNDPKARSRAQAVETQVRKLYKIPMHQQTPDSLIQAMIAAYPTVYGHTQKGAQGTNALLPSNDMVKNQGKGGKFGGVGGSGRVGG